MRCFWRLLVAATFIDYDLMIIPDQITFTGMVVGVGDGDALASRFDRCRPWPPSLIFKASGSACSACWSAWA